MDQKLKDSLAEWEQFWLGAFDPDEVDRVNVLFDMPSVFGYGDADLMARWITAKVKIACPRNLLSNQQCAARLATVKREIGNWLEGLEPDQVLEVQAALDKIIRTGGS